jgi:hypothetical protein
VSRTRPNKTIAEYEEEAILKYVNEHSESFEMEDLSEELLADGWDVSIPSKKTVLTKRLKQRARELRTKDKQGRKVRSMHAAKTTREEADGSKTTSVKYAHIYSMSFDHAFISFRDRFENNQKQDNALWRDVDSFNDYNPNAGLQKIQKELFCLDDEQEEQVVEILEEILPKQFVH